MVRALAISRDGRRLARGGQDGRLVHWGVGHRACASRRVFSIRIPPPADAIEKQREFPDAMLVALRVTANLSVPTAIVPSRSQPKMPDLAVGRLLVQGGTRRIPRSAGLLDGRIFIGIEYACKPFDLSYCWFWAASQLLSQCVTKLTLPGLDFWILRYDQTGYGLRTSVRGSSALRNSQCISQPVPGIISAVAVIRPIRIGKIRSRNLPNAETIRHTANCPNTASS